QVAGHTDDVPIKNAVYPSNWELSTARALQVIHYLEGKGVNAAQLSATGYADVDPVASNTTAEGRKQNRRLEITLQPNITEVTRAKK
ncbi:MAG TPA: OmpA family protein, partial [Polyangiaceae bacterium]